MEEKKLDIGNIREIKSLYNMKLILSFLPIKQKLKLFLYNKKMQNEIEISLEDYKKISQRYKVVEKDGSGKEYAIYTNIVVFEGEYQNGKRHGKGKEYHDCNGKLKFNGEFFEGRKMTGTEYDIEGNQVLTLENGRGKEYYDNEVVRFEGEFYNGKKWNGNGYNYKGEKIFEIKYGNGKVKEYNYRGKLLYSGTYKNGERNGNGIEYYDNGFTKFKGEYSNGDRYNGKILDIKGFCIIKLECGRGIEYYKNGKILFEGEYFFGRRWNGVFHEPFANKKYNLDQGKGIIVEYNDSCDLIFSGHLLNGRKNGNGIEYINKDEKKYEGDFSNDMRHGNGKIYIMIA